MTSAAPPSAADFRKVRRVAIMIFFSRIKAAARRIAFRIRG